MFVFCKKLSKPKVNLGASNRITTTTGQHFSEREIFGSTVHKVVEDITFFDDVKGKGDVEFCFEGGGVVADYKISCNFHGSSLKTSCVFISPVMVMLIVGLGIVRHVIQLVDYFWQSPQ